MGKDIPEPANKKLTLRGVEAVNTSAWKLGERAGGIALAILAAFLAAFVAIGDARADGENAGGDDNWHIGGKCSGSHAIPHTSSTCLHAWWDNSPSAALVSTAFGAQSHCSSYGTVVAEIRLERGTNEHFHIPDADKIRGSDNYRDVDNVYCCLNHSDLCWKKQVEKNDEGKISHITTPSSSILTETSVDVSTHWARYQFCQANPDYIYCQVDPEGDAHTVPSSPPVNPDTASMHDLRARPCGGEGEPRCTCGGHICDRFDCKWSFNQSPASRTCRDMTGSQGAGFRHSESAMWSCSLSHMICRVAEYYIGQGNMHRYEGTGGQALTASMSDIRKLNNCDGVLSTSPCPVTYSTCLSNYNASSANGTCRNETITTVDDDTGNWCNVEAECVDQQGNWDTSNIKVLPGYADELRNCNGLLDLEC